MRRRVLSTCPPCLSPFSACPAIFASYKTSTFFCIRDRSLITEGREATKREAGGGGGVSEVLPLRKGGGGRSFSHAKGGHKTCSGIVLTWEL